MTKYIFSGIFYYRGLPNFFSKWGGVVIFLFVCCFLDVILKRLRIILRVIRTYSVKGSSRDRSYLVIFLLPHNFWKNETKTVSKIRYPAASTSQVVESVSTFFLVLFTWKQCGDGCRSAVCPAGAPGHGCRPHTQVGDPGHGYGPYKLIS